MRVAAITTPTVSPFALKSKVVLSSGRMHLAYRSCSLPSQYGRRQHSVGCLVKADAGNHSREPINITRYVNNLANHLWEISPGPVKEFPWKKVSSITMEYLLNLANRLWVITPKPVKEFPWKKATSITMEYLLKLANCLWVITPEPVKKFPWKKASSITMEYLLNLANRLWVITPEPVKEFPWKKASSIAIECLLNLANHLWVITPEPVKEFPWKKASSIAIERLLFLMQKAVKWSLIVLLTISVVSDVTLAFSRSVELLFPLGLFTGVMLAEFMKESSEEFFKSNEKGGDVVRRLSGFASFFLLVKFVSLFLGVQGRVFLSHVSNGGLMQVWWWAKGQQQTTENVQIKEGQIQDTPISSSSESS